MSQVLFWSSAGVRRPGDGLPQPRHPRRRPWLLACGGFIATRLLCVLPAMVLCGQASAALLTDGVLSLTVSETGEFNSIYFAGEPVDASAFVQIQSANGEELVDESGVNVAGTTATYDASITDFDIAVTTRILAVPGLSASARALEQVFAFTNSGAAAASLSTVSYLRLVLGGDGSDDAVQWQPDPTRAVRVRDPGLVAQALPGDATAYAWSIQTLQTLPDPTAYSDLDNQDAQPAAGEAEFAVGLDLGTVAAGDTVSAGFRYLFGNDPSVYVDYDLTVSHEPSPVPAPSSAMLMLGGLAVFAARRGRRCILGARARRPAAG